MWYWVFPLDERAIIVSTAVLKGSKPMESSSSDERELFFSRLRYLLLFCRNIVIHSQSERWWRWCAGKVWRRSRNSTLSPSKSHSRAVSCPSQILGAFRCTISFMKEMAQFGAFKRRKAVAIFKIRQNRNQRTKMLLECGLSERPCSSEISANGGQNLIPGRRFYCPIRCTRFQAL